VTRILGGDSHSHFSPLRDKEFLVSPYFPDPHTIECGGRSPRRRTRATLLSYNEIGVHLKRHHSFILNG